jgi:pyruvate kinase
MDKKLDAESEAPVVLDQIAAPARQRSPVSRRAGARARLASRTVERLIAVVSDLRDEALRMERRFARDIARVPPAYRASARNLMHYLALRQRDIRPLQTQLAALGLSSLGRCEPNTLAGLSSVLGVLMRLAGMPSKGTTTGSPTGSTARPAVLAAKPPVDFESGPIRLERHTRRLLGRRPAHRATHIMVTMPSEAAHDPNLIERLLRSGMDIMRINGAHDDVTEWAAMVGHLRRARRATGLRCKILMDLAGPKLRTGALESEPGLVKVKPERDRRGVVTAPARIWMARAGDAPPSVHAELPVLPVMGAWPTKVTDVIVHDARGKKRSLTVESRVGASLLCASERTIYVEGGARVSFLAKGERRGHGRVGDLAPAPQAIMLRTGDRLVLTRSAVAGHPARRGANGPEPARIPCTLPQVFRDVQAGEPVWFDDGKIGGIVVGNDGNAIEVRITHARAAGAALSPDKGINLPESNLRLSGLTGKDRRDLSFAGRQADLVALSFAQRPEDIRTLARLLGRARKHPAGIVLKIETRRGFEALPRLLLAALQTPPVGVMVARGDLAVEVGFERLAEVQEEILWLCEAAHVPAIWATQVLETLTKKGAPSRAEVTDAAMAVRAECVMLNKGPYVAEAVAFLDNVLRRMQDHQTKKRAMLRKLSVAGEEQRRAIPAARPAVGEIAPVPLTRSRAAVQQAMPTPPPARTVRGRARSGNQQPIPQAP